MLGSTWGCAWEKSAYAEQREEMNTIHRVGDASSNIFDNNMKHILKERESKSEKPASCVNGVKCSAW